MKTNNMPEQIQSLKSLAGSIAHETRNPLSAIKNACEIIKENMNQAIEFIDLISICANRGLMISEMILNNLRDGEIKNDNFVYLQIGKVCIQAIKEFSFESKTQRNLVNFDLKDDFKFLGDENLMIFVLFNLLKNSLYFNSKIEIWLNSKTRTLHFKDYGVGISEEKLPYIFDDFFTSNKKGGTGLGLPFCKRVMTAFGGNISVKSEFGKSIEFYLQF
jgi:signal transduction histidine kinase